MQTITNINNGNPVFSASGPVTSSLNGLHPKSKFLAIIKLITWTRFGAFWTTVLLATMSTLQAEQSESSTNYTPSCETDHYRFTRLNQGENWTPADWNDYYTQDLGSWIMPYPWAKALRQPNGQFFLRDSLTRYGYIPNLKSRSNPEGLPVGFMVANPGTLNPQFAMNCAACHTRQLTVNGTAYRADGGPAFSDMYSFFKDVLGAFNYTITNPLAFQQFQRAVKTPADQLLKEMQNWYALNNLVYGQALPSTSWGIGRLDAISNINNRVDGGFLGHAPNFLIPQNVATANVPVRYPFLWNADRQDRTQWAGTAINGNEEYALVRNAGETSGAWGLLFPVGNDYLKANSLNYEGIVKIGSLTPNIGPPKWAWPIDQKKAARGKLIYNARNSCNSCHGIQQGAARPPVTDTWFTQVLDVGTDGAYYSVLERTSFSSGVLTGVTIPFTDPPVSIGQTGEPSFQLVGTLNELALVQKFPTIQIGIKPYSLVSYAFESRVLQGIWAAAPYLHNGSVPTLAELLKPAAQRVKSFQVGPEYDLKNIGLARVQPGGKATIRQTSDYANGNDGHEFGVLLPEKDKEALLEYLKTL